jgi:surface antigen
MIRLRTLSVSAAALTFFAATASAQAGLTSNTESVALSAVKSTSLTVTVNSGATQNIASITDNAVNTFPSAVNITTAWDINPSAASVTLVGYFANAAQALSNGTFHIATTQVKGRVTTAGAPNAPTSFTAFTSNAVGAVGTAGGSLTLFSETITGANKNSNRTIDLELQLDLTGQTTTPGTYTGTLNLRAVTQ